MKEVKTDWTVNGVIEELDFYKINVGDFFCKLSKEKSVRPQKNDTLTIYSYGTPYGEIFGMDINGIVAFRYTESELQKKQEEKYEKALSDKIELYKSKAQERGNKINSLPPFLKNYIEKYKSKNSETILLHSLDEEIFCCEQAAIISSCLKSENEIELFMLFNDKRKRKVCPKLSYNHNEITFQWSCCLAKKMKINERHTN